MSSTKKGKQSERRTLTGGERLGLRVSAMINSPVAQLNRRVVIHRLDTDDDESWQGVMEQLSDTDGLNMTFSDDGSVILEWDQSPDEEQVLGREEMEAVREVAPF